MKTPLHYDTRGHGPALLILQAGASGPEGSHAIAPHLEPHFTVVTYQRRGQSATRVPEGTRVTIADHADDAAHIIEQVGGTAYVLGVSIGAMIGLELVRRHPTRVRKLVAHEPPLLELLSEPRRGQIRAAHEAVERVFAERGLAAALDSAVELGEIDPSDREPDAVPPVPALEHSLRFFLANDAGMMRMYEPRLAELDAGRIVVATGSSGPDRWIRAITTRLAHELGLPLTEMPGGHIGYQLRPRAYAAALTALTR